MDRLLCARFGPDAGRAWKEERIEIKRTNRKKNGSILALLNTVGRLLSEN
jgi:hypothetical protein